MLSEKKMLSVENVGLKSKVVVRLLSPASDHLQMKNNMMSIITRFFLFFFVFFLFFVVGQVTSVLKLLIGQHIESLHVESLYTSNSLAAEII